MSKFSSHLPRDDLDAAILAEALASHNGLFALLERLTKNNTINRDDIRAVAEAVDKAYQTPHVCENLYVQQIQHKTDEFLAALSTKAGPHS